MSLLFSNTVLLLVRMSINNLSIVKPNVFRVFHKMSSEPRCYSVIEQKIRLEIIQRTSSRGPSITVTNLHKMFLLLISVDSKCVQNSNETIFQVHPILISCPNYSPGKAKEMAIRSNYHIFRKF